MKKVIFLIMVGILLFGSIGCGQSVAGYLKEKGINSEIGQIVKPLGGLDQNKKVLIDELVSLPAELQKNEKVLSLLREIVIDKIVTSEELARFQDLDQDGLKTLRK